MTARRSRCRHRRQDSEIPGEREILRGEFENSIKIGFFTESWGNKQGLRRSPKKLHVEEA